MNRDRVHQAREIAAAPTLERMRRDAEKLPPQLSRLMTYLAKHLFDTKLTATRAWKEAPPPGLLNFIALAAADLATAAVAAVVIAAIQRPAARALHLLVW